MREETGLELSSNTSMFSFDKHELSPTTCRTLHETLGNKEMKTRRSLLLKNLQTHEDSFHVVSIVTEVSQGLMGTQRKGNKLSPGRSGEAFGRSNALPTLQEAQEGRSLPGRVSI